VLSDGAGNGEFGAGCPAVVVVGVVGGVGVGVGVGRGGGAAVVRAGAAGFAVAARGRCGAVTVTGGTGTVPGGAACGVSGAACGVCGGVVGACGVVCGACGGGVSGVIGVVVCGVSCGAGACAEVAPAKQSATSAELLRSSKRLLWIDMITPRSMTENDPSAPNIDASRRKPCGVWHGHRRSEAVPTPRAMSGDGRRARAEWGVMEGGDELKLDRRQEQQSAECRNSRQSGRLGRRQRAGKMNERAERAVVVGDGRRLLARGIDRCLRNDRCVARGRRAAVEMHVPERDDELERQRKQREIRTQSRTRSEPAHGRYASV
jgi:hypothetical protein